MPAVEIGLREANPHGQRSLRVRQFPACPTLGMSGLVAFVDGVGRGDVPRGEPRDDMLVDGHIRCYCCCYATLPDDGGADNGSEDALGVHGTGRPMNPSERYISSSDEAANLGDGPCFWRGSDLSGEVSKLLSETAKGAINNIVPVAWGERITQVFLFIAQGGIVPGQSSRSARF